jgi:metal-dependent HD superfamily phosphatase/phosphodiesterase
LPNQLKTGIESLSGMSMDHVKVHYNSSKPAQLNAHAYAQGSQIHLASGQEKHLPHEAWHVVQQAQGRVQATTQMKESVPVNDDVGLEREADVMGAKAASVSASDHTEIG